MGADTEPRDARPKVPTLEDVARLAGVSTATVSRTLNSPDRVRTETRLAVENAVTVLGYTPNFGGQALASRRSNTIGAIIPTMANSIFATAVQALQETLAARNVMLLVASSQYSPMREQTQLRTLLARGVDGIALIGSERPPEVYDILESRRVPFALLWSAPRASSHLTIGFDNAAAASEVARNVLAAGHRRIALLTGMIEGNDRARARLQGVTEELARAGITLDPGDIVALPYTLDDGEAGAIRLLARPDRPTAIICGNDVLAAGAMRGARAMGLSIPGDVSVTGFDDIELATAVSPALTTVRVPHRRMGEAAGQALLEWIETGQQPRSIGFPAEFIARSSLGRPPGG